MTSSPDLENPSDPPVLHRFVKVIVSIIVLVPLTVFLGYGGGIVLTVTATIRSKDSGTENGETLRERLLAWPERNREVLRTNGRAELPLKP